MAAIRDKILARPHSGVHLWLLLWKATAALETHARCSIQATGLCLSDFGVLEALLHKGPQPVNVLGKKILVSSGSATAAVDRLERALLVRRTPAANDRRARIVRLTPRGSALIRRLFARHARDLDRALAGFSAADAAALANLLRRLGRGAESVRPRSPAGPRPPAPKNRG